MNSSATKVDTETVLSRKHAQPKMSTFPTIHVYDHGAQCCCGLRLFCPTTCWIQFVGVRRLDYALWKQSWILCFLNQFVAAVVEDEGLMITLKAVVRDLCHLDNQEKIEVSPLYGMVLNSKRPYLLDTLLEYHNGCRRDLNRLHNYHMSENSNITLLQLALNYHAVPDVVRSLLRYGTSIDATATCGRFSSTPPFALLKLQQLAARPAFCAAAPLYPLVRGCDRARRILLVRIYRSRVQRAITSVVPRFPRAIVLIVARLLVDGSSFRV
jgi:hypothetical protein